MEIIKRVFRCSYQDKYVQFREYNHQCFHPNYTEYFNVKDGVFTFNLDTFINRDVIFR